MKRKKTVLTSFEKNKIEIDFDEIRNRLRLNENRNGIDIVAKEKIDEIGFVKKSVSVAVTFLEYPFLI